MNNKNGENLYFDSPVSSESICIYMPGSRRFHRGVGRVCVCVGGGGGGPGRKFLTTFFYFFKSPWERKGEGSVSIFLRKSISII